MGTLQVLFCSIPLPVITDRSPIQLSFLSHFPIVFTLQVPLAVPVAGQGPRGGADGGGRAHRHLPGPHAMDYVPIPFCQKVSKAVFLII